jgi:hypothetical protein
MNRETVGTLTGKYFHSIKADKETIQWMGKFIGLASPGLYRIQTFSWIDGTDDEQLLVPALDMRYWKIYDTEQEMTNYYASYCERRKIAREATVTPTPSTVNDGKGGAL